MDALENWTKIWVKGRRRPCAAKPQEEESHAVRKINRAVSMKIAIEDSKRCSIAAEKERERLKTVSQRRGVDETISF